MQEDVRSIPVEEIHEPFILLRPVIRNHPDYLEKEGSIQQKGLLDSICVRPDPRKPGYEVVDGMYRFVICTSLGYTEMPCIVKHGMSDAELLAAQIDANENRVPPSPTEYAKQLRRIKNEVPGCTLNDIAHMCGRSASWVKKQLNLLNIKREYQKYVDRGDMTLEAAYSLSKIPPSLQKNYIDKALTWDIREFKALAASVVKKVWEESRKGKLETLYVNEFVAHPYLRPLKEVVAELKTGAAAARVLIRDNCQTAFEGWMSALRWASRVDSASIESRQAEANMKHKQHVKERIESDKEDLNSGL